MLNGNSKLVWPSGRKFAFTIVDDTDWATVENVGPVYDFLFENGFLTTKTVWPLAPLGRTSHRGLSLEDEDYKRWVLAIRDKGVEIALHGVSDESSTRARVIEGLRGFEEIIGYSPRLHANHTQQAECIYWGSERFDGLTKHLYKLARERLLKGESKYYGHVEESDYFWGDLCRETVTFVRNFVFGEINTLKSDPLMPYHDPQRPYVRFWFSSSAAIDAGAFCELLSEANQDRLVAEGGACIVYTHLAFRFCEDGRLNPRFAALMRRLAGLGGWFVPASTLLAYIGDQRGWHTLSGDRRGLHRLERKWLYQKLLRGRNEENTHFP